MIASILIFNLYTKQIWRRFSNNVMVSVWTLCHNALPWIHPWGIRQNEDDKRPKGPQIVHLCTMCYLYLQIGQGGYLLFCLSISPKNTMGDFIWYQSSYNSNQSESNLRHLNFDPYPSRTRGGPWVTLVATHTTMRMSLIFKCPIISIVSELSGFWGVSTIKWNSYPTLL